VKAIYKYELSEEKVQWVSLPIGSTVLSVVEQYQKVVMYAIVDNETQGKIQIQIEFLMLGTGQFFDDVFESHSFLNTVKLSGGNVMVHVFAEKGWGLT